MAGLPELKALLTKHADKGFAVVAPSLDAKDVVEKVRKEKGLDFPLLAGAKLSAKSWDVQLYPGIFLVGRDGKLLWKGLEKNEAFHKALQVALEAK